MRCSRGLGWSCSMAPLHVLDECGPAIMQTHYVTQQFHECYTMHATVNLRSCGGWECSQHTRIELYVSQLGCHVSACLHVQRRLPLHSQRSLTHGVKHIALCGWGPGVCGWCSKYDLCAATSAAKHASSAEHLLSQSSRLPMLEVHVLCETSGARQVACGTLTKAWACALHPGLP